MIRISTLLLALLFCFGNFLVGTPSALAQQKKIIRRQPSGQSHPNPRRLPFVKQKEYEETIEDLKAKITRLQSTIYSLKNESKSEHDTTLGKQSARMDSLMVQLSAVSSEVKSAADSIRLTNTTFSTFQDNVDEKFETVNNDIAEAKNYGMIGLGVILLLNIVGLVIIGSAGASGRRKQNQKLETAQENMNNEMAQFKEGIEKNNKDMDSTMSRRLSLAESRLEKMIKDSSSSSEDQLNGIKKQVDTAKNDLEVKIAKLKGEVDVIKSENV